MVATLASDDPDGPGSFEGPYADCVGNPGELSQNPARPILRSLPTFAPTIHGRDLSEP